MNNCLVRAVRLRAAVARGMHSFLSVLCLAYLTPLSRPSVD